MNRFLFTAMLLLASALNMFGGTVSVDENGNAIGTVGRGFLANDPGPGGLSGVLTYNLGFTVVPGDVLLNAAEGIFDVVRFNPNGTLVFYSDNIPTADALADTPGPPRAFYSNRIIIAEVGPEGANSATYTPGPNQPGYTAGGVTYVLVSDGTLAPEPGAMSLMLAAGACLSVLLVRNKKHSN